MIFARPPVRRTRDGRYAVTLGDHERGLLRILPAQMSEILTETDDPALRRLFPPAYSAPGDEEHAVEFRRLMTEDLLERHRAALDVLRSTADATELTEEQVEGWMRALNSLRLLLGTRLDVSDDDDVTTHQSDEHTLYYFLGYLQECVVAALSRDD